MPSRPQSSPDCSPLSSLRPNTTASRRRVLAAALGLTLVPAGHLAAQDATPPSTPDATPDATPGATPEAVSWPRTVQAVTGPVEILSRPERVVAISDWYEVDYLMAAGVRPVLYGYTNRYGQGVSPWLSGAGGDDLERYDLAAEVDIEWVTVAEPDLIVSDAYFAQEVIDLLTAIAPTVVIPTPFSGSTDWREAQRLVGQSTGADEAAEEAISLTEEVIAGGRERLAAYADRTVSIAYASEYNGGSLFFAPDDSQEAGIIRSLGLTYLGLGPDNAPYSFEDLDRLRPADILLSYDFMGSTELLTGTDLFRATPAYVEGRFVPVDETTTRALFSPTTLSVRWVIDRLVEAIVTGAEGNGLRP